MTSREDTPDLKDQDKMKVKKKVFFPTSKRTSTKLNK